MGVSSVLAALRGRLLKLVLAYIVVECVRYRRFLANARRLRVPCVSDRRGTAADARWLRQAAQHAIYPLVWAGTWTWEKLYLHAQALLRLDGPSLEEHRELVLFAAALSARHGLPKPPPGLEDRVDAVLGPPVAPVLGGQPVLACFKPLPILGCLELHKAKAGWALWRLGFARGRVLTPEGELHYWLRPAGKGASESHEKPRPVVFLPGACLHLGPYLPVMEQLTACAGAVCCLELGSAGAPVPSPSHFRQALSQLLHVLGVQHGHYALLAHELGTAFAGYVMNDPKGGLKPSRLALLDPVCFAHELPQTWRGFARTLQEDGESLQAVGRHVLGCQDLRLQQLVKRHVSSGPDVLIRCPPGVLRSARTFVGISKQTAAEGATAEAWGLVEYLRSHFPDISVRIDTGADRVFAPSLAAPFARAGFSLGLLRSATSFLDEAESRGAVMKTQSLRDLLAYSEGKDVPPGTPERRLGRSLHLRTASDGGLEPRPLGPPPSTPLVFGENPMPRAKSREREPPQRVTRRLGPSRSTEKLLRRPASSVPSLEALVAR